MHPVLQGAIYDPYVRRILFEGVFDSWTDDISPWLTCPMPTSLRPTSEKVKASGAMTWKSAFGIVRGGIQTIVSMLSPRMGVDILPDGPIVCPYYWAQSIHQLNCDIVWPAEVDARFDTRFDSTLHDCSVEEDASDDLGWDALRPKTGARVIQLDTPKYAGVIAQRMVVERLLAQGGMCPFCTRTFESSPGTDLD
jgi:hypothetical protein